MKKFFLLTTLFLLGIVMQVNADGGVWVQVSRLDDLQEGDLIFLCLEDGGGGNGRWSWKTTAPTYSYSSGSLEFVNITGKDLQTIANTTNYQYYYRHNTKSNLTDRIVLHAAVGCAILYCGGLYASYGWGTSPSEVPSENCVHFEEDGTGHFHIYRSRTKVTDPIELMTYTQGYKNYYAFAWCCTGSRRGVGNGTSEDICNMSNDVYKNGYHSQFEEGWRYNLDEFPFNSCAISISVYKFLPSYDATFVIGEHGTYEGVAPTDNKINGVDITLPSVIANEGYTFMGWNTKEDGTGINVSELGTTYRITAPTTFYAQYAPIPAGFDIVSWTKSSVVIDLLASAEFVTITKNLDPSFTTQELELSSCKLQGDAGVFELPLPQDNITTHPGEKIMLSFRDGNDNPCGSISITIPHLITSATNISSISPLTEDAEIYVLRGGTLTIDASATCANMTIKGGGKVVVATSQTLTVSEKLIMRGGAIENGKYAFRYPQLVLNGTLAVTQEKVYYDYLIDNAQYYTLVLPYDVTIADITYRNGSAMTRGDGVNSTYDYKIQYYDGAARATNGASGGTGWALVASGTTELTAGQGYNIFAKPKTVRINGGSSQRQKYAIVRLPMNIGASYAENTDKQVTVTAHPATANNDAGWNLVGNPYCSNYNALTLSAEGGIGLLEELGDGSYQWTGTQRYVVIPANDGQSYTQTLASSANLPAFKSFFVQVATNGSLSFTLANRAASAPALMVKEEPAKEIMTGLTIRGCNMNDNMGVLIGEQFTDDYEINADLDKWTNNGLNIYALSNASRLAYIAIPEVSAKNIPMGIATTQAGTYTIALDETYNNANIEAIKLYDSQAKREVNLLAEDYTFSTSTGRIENRFNLSISLRAKAPTEIEKVTIEQDAVYYGILGNYMGTNYEALPLGTYIQVVNGKANQVVLKNE